MSDETLVQRVLTRADAQHAAAQVNGGRVQQFITRVVGLLFMLAGMGLILGHQVAAKAEHAPELYLLIPSITFVVLGAAAFMPRVLHIATATIRELMPFGKKGG